MSSQMRHTRRFCYHASLVGSCFRQDRAVRRRPKLLLRPKCRRSHRSGQEAGTAGRTELYWSVTCSCSGLSGAEDAVLPAVIGRAEVVQGRGPNADSAARTDKRMIDLHGETGRMRQEWAHIPVRKHLSSKAWSFSRLSDCIPCMSKRSLGWSAVVNCRCTL